MTSWWAVVEARHDIQDPVSAGKVRRLGEVLALGPGSTVLDAGAGRGGPALLLARTFGCDIVCVEHEPEFAAAARARAREAGLQDRISVVEMDARDFQVEPGAYDAALCVGASFIWGGLEPTVARLLPGVRDGGFVAVGEPYWRTWPLPAGFPRNDEEDFGTLADTVARFERCGVEPVTVIASSQDDWDRYESLHWLTLEDWLRRHPDAREAAEFRGRGAAARDRYLRWERDLLGWAILVGRPDAGPG